MKRNTSNGRPVLGQEEKMGMDVDPKRLVKLNLEFVDPVGCADFTVKKIERISKSTNGNAKFKPYNAFSVNGTGFDAFVVAATMRTVLASDYKPEIASVSDATQISMPANNSAGGSVGQTSSSFFFGDQQSANMFIKMTKGDMSVNVDVDQNPSPSGLYDCFFLFHNDTSHTILNNDNCASAHKTYDQYIDLTINPI